MEGESWLLAGNFWGENGTHIFEEEGWDISWGIPCVVEVQKGEKKHRITAGLC